MDLDNCYKRYLESRKKYTDLKLLGGNGDGPASPGPTSNTENKPTTLSKLSHRDGRDPEYLSVNIEGSDPVVIANERASIKYNENNILWRGNLSKHHHLRPEMIAWIALSKKDALLYGYPLKLRVFKEFKILNIEIPEVRNAIRALLEKSGIESELKAFDDAFPTDMDGTVRRMSMFDLDTAFIGGLNREWPTDWLNNGYLGLGAGRIYLSDDDEVGHHSEMVLFFKGDHTSDEYLASLLIDYDAVTEEQAQEFAIKERSLEDKRRREEAKANRRLNLSDNTGDGLPKQLFGDDEDDDMSDLATRLF